MRFLSLLLNRALHAPEPRTPVNAAIPPRPAPQMAWLMPSRGGCFDEFVVSARNQETGRPLPPRRVRDANATFKDLSPGATYSFSIAASGNGGTGPTSTAAAAMLPNFLPGVAPGPPDALAGKALNATSVQLMWGRPSGNPKVDEYVIKAVPANATGCGACWHATSSRGSWGAQNIAWSAPRRVRRLSRGFRLWSFV